MLWGKKYDDRLDGINEATISFCKMLSVVFFFYELEPGSNVAKTSNSRERVRA